MSQRWDELARRIAQHTGLAGTTLDLENVRRAAQRAYRDATPERWFALDYGWGGAWDALIDELTVRETYFFRHADQFELLRRRVLPELREQPVVRVWSAGCASGEEAYSLAMLFEQEGLLDRVSVLATDISRAAIDRARAARYRDWSFRALPSTALQHFRSDGALRVVTDQLRNHVSFRQLNLAEPTYPSLLNDTCAFSLIFCRNVLMFLDLETIAAVATRLHAALIPGGWLFTGPSDPNLGQFAAFEVHVTPAGLLYRRALDGRPLTAARLVSQPAPVFELPQIELAPMPPPAAASAPVIACAPLAAEIRAAWNALGPEAALARCTNALAYAEAQLELHHLEALLLWELRRIPEATSAMRRVLYLDRSNALAHFGLGALLERAGDAGAARRSYRNALACCDKLPPSAAVPLGDGILAAGLRAEVVRSLRRVGGEEALLT